MDRHDSDTLHVAPLATTELPVETSAIMRCCVATIGDHVKHNPMMVCSGCKQIIKCFKDFQPYKNFLTFCESRRRAVTIGQVSGYHTIIFRNFDKPTFR